MISRIYLCNTQVVKNAQVSYVNSGSMRRCSKCGLRGMKKEEKRVEEGRERRVTPTQKQEVALCNDTACHRNEHNHNHNDGHSLPNINCKSARVDPTTSASCPVLSYPSCPAISYILSCPFPRMSRGGNGEGDLPLTSHPSPLGSS
jgi:hypothetical protein